MVVDSSPTARLDEHRIIWSLRARWFPSPMDVDVSVDAICGGCMALSFRSPERRWRDAVFEGPFGHSPGRTKFAEPINDTAMRFIHRWSTTRPSTSCHHSGVSPSVSTRTDQDAPTFSGVPRSASTRDRPDRPSYVSIISNRASNSCPHDVQWMQSDSTVNSSDLMPMPPQSGQRARCTR